VSALKVISADTMLCPSPWPASAHCWCSFGAAALAIATGGGRPALALKGLANNQPTQDCADEGRARLTRRWRESNLRCADQVPSGDAG
jgi:hypothetical protein